MSGLHVSWIRRGDSGIAPLLRVAKLSVRVGARRVLDLIDFSVHSGDHICITGPNGCGKSTLFNAIAGIEPARIEGGSIVFAGKDITDTPPHERAALGISYMRQTDNVFPSLSVRENLELALGPTGYERFAYAFPEWSIELSAAKRAGQLSGGEKKKLAWAMAVIAEKQLVLADEPEAGVAQRFQIPSNLKTYVVITHDEPLADNRSGA